MIIIPETCEICESTEWTLVYSDKIRNGAFGNYINGNIFRCGGCGVDRLDEDANIKGNAYQTEEYRDMLNQGLGVTNYFKQADPIQIHNLSAFWPLEIRGKKIADIGTGGGSFLDNISGQAQEIIAIEPTEMYHSSLKKRGYQTFSYTADALTQYRNKMDYVFSFQVIEHVLNPNIFINEGFKLLRPGGKMIVATPNRNNILLKLLPEDFKSFFYCSQHRWYFDKASITNCFQQATERKAQLETVKFVQVFGISNTLAWLKEKQPKGNLCLDGINTVADKLWSSYLESSEQTDTIFMMAEKKETT